MIRLLSPISLVFTCCLAVTRHVDHFYLLWKPPCRKYIKINFISCRDVSATAASLLTSLFNSNSIQQPLEATLRIQELAIESGDQEYEGADVV